jgi:hypothetical protein
MEPLYRSIASVIGQEVRKKLILVCQLCSSQSRIILILFLLGFVGQMTVVQAQTLRIDSLRYVLGSSSVDTQRIKIMYDLAYEFSRSNTDSAEFYALKSFNLAKELNHERGLLRG